MIKHKTICKIIVGAIFVALTFLSYGVESTPVMLTKVTGGDEQYTADVILDGGIKKMAVQATAVIEQVFGQPPNAGTWFFFGNTTTDANGIDASGDTVRIQIPAANPPLDLIYPAVDFTYTVTLADASSDNPEKTVSANICNEIRNDANFDAAQWRCQAIRDFGGVFISSKLFNEFGERTSYSVTCSGGTICNLGEGSINRAGAATELTRSPNDPRIGQLAIVGSVTVSSQSVSELVISTLKDSGGAGSDLMNVNGSVTPVKFEYNADQTGDFNIIVQKISCFCSGSGIQFTKFCSLNGALTNGILFSVTSEGITTSLATIKSTDDWKHIFTLGDTTQYAIDIQAGQDDLMSTAVFDPPIILESNSNDEIAATVRDNVTGVTAMKCRVFGFKREL